VRIFKNTWFTRFASKEGVTDALNAGELIEIQEATMKKYQSGVLKVIHQIKYAAAIR
jgi:hypothetical protein